MRQVQQIMGMPIIIDIPGAGEDIFDEVFTRLRQIDEKFSTYRPDSEVVKYSKGKLKEENLSRELGSIISACREAEKMTNGYFSAWASGSFDPSGYVKGWAINQAGGIIKKSGHHTFCISAGGDILAGSNGDRAWNIGIQDPKDNTKILNKLSIYNGSVATSGNYERGKHIINPITKKPANGFISVTIAGPDIIKADVLATAVFAMGPNPGRKFIKGQKEYKAILVTN